MVNSFLLGAAKCGTTSLASWLAHNPDICVSKPKEPRYFLMASEYIKGPDYYIGNHFAHCRGEKIVIDCHPYNLYYDFIPERIKETVGEPKKAIIIIRDPIARAYSDWAYFKRMRPGREVRDFQTAIQNNFDVFNPDWARCEGDYEMVRDLKGGTYRTTYLENGMYWHHTRRYFRAFPSTAFMFVVLDDLYEDPYSVIEKIHQFLGVREEIHFDAVSLNTGGYVKTETLNKENPWLVENMKLYFQDDVKRMGNFIDRDLVKEWW